MYTLKPDEKTTPVMLYTQDKLVRGEVVTTQNVLRVSIWLRTDGAPKYMHLLKPHVIVFGGSPVKALSYSEIYFPTSQLIAFHLMPSIEEPLDYDANETNRMMQEVDVLAGSFVMKGRIRISTHSDLRASLETARVAWMSLYDVLVANPYLPQMPAMQVPMALVNPSQVAFALA